MVMDASWLCRRCCCHCCFYCCYCCRMRMDGRDDLDFHQGQFAADSGRSGPRRRPEVGVPRRPCESASASARAFSHVASKGAHRGIKSAVDLATVRGCHQLDVAISSMARTPLSHSRCTGLPGAPGCVVPCSRRIRPARDGVVEPVLDRPVVPLGVVHPPRARRL